MMHRQANFFAAFFPEGTQVRRRATARCSTFYFPSPTRVTRSWSAAPAPAAFRDAPEVWKVMQYLGSPEYANARQTAQTALAGGGGISGFLTGQHATPTRAWTPTLEQGSSRRCQPANPAGFDASDQMPAEVGSGHVLDRGHVVRQRRRGRQDGGRQHRGLLADELTAAGRR